MPMSVQAPAAIHNKDAIQAETTFHSERRKLTKKHWDTAVSRQHGRLQQMCSGAISLRALKNVLELAGGG